MQTRRILMQTISKQTAVWTLMSGSRLGCARARPSFSIDKFGARSGEGGDDLRQRARQNAAAINQAIAAAKAAGGGTVVFPGRHYLITADAPAREGHLTRRGPVSQAIRLEGCQDITLTPAGSEARLVRLESEVTGQPQDALNTTLSINTSRNIRIEGLSFEGQQSSDVKRFTTGDSIQINFGSRDIQIAHVTLNKGTNGIAVGSNRTEYGAHQRGLGEPVKAVEIKDVDIFNCEHGILVNVAEDVLLEDIRHSSKPYEFRLQLQESYIQRGVYLLNCRKVILRKARLLDTSKVALFMALYPKRRAFSDLEDITIENVKIASRHQYSNDWEIGVQIFDQNQAGATPTQARRLRLQDIAIDDMKTAVSLRSKFDSVAETPAVAGMQLSRISSRTFRAGVVINPNVVFSDLALTASSFDVCPKRLDGGLAGLSINATGNNDRVAASHNLTLGNLQVRSQAPAVIIGPVNGVNMMHCYFKDQRLRPSKEREDLRLEGTTHVSRCEVTLANAISASKSC